MKHPLLYPNVFQLKNARYLVSMLLMLGLAYLFANVRVERPQPLPTMNGASPDPFEMNAFAAAAADAAVTLDSIINTEEILDKLHETVKAGGGGGERRSASKQLTLKEEKEKLQWKLKSLFDARLARQELLKLVSGGGKGRKKEVEDDEVKRKEEDGAIAALRKQLSAIKKEIAEKERTKHGKGEI
jgi:hypothetical protein